MQNNEVFIIEDGTLERYAGPGKNVAIPDGVKTIAAKAFQGNSRLRSVRFPDREVDLESAAFAKCTGLEHVEFPRKAPLWLSRTFYRCRSLGQIRLPECQKVVGKYCFFRCTALRNATMPRVEAIRNAAFSGCTALEEVRLPPTLRVLDYRAFHQCRRLKEIVFPAKLDRIGDQAFAHCTGLERVVLPRRIARLGDGVFARCPRLKAKNIEWPGHTDAEKRELLSCHDYSPDRSRLSDPISREIARMERVERGFCESDWANLGDYLLVLLPDMLREFADGHFAYPMGMTYEQWNGILRETDSHFRSARTWLVSDSRHDMLEALVRRCAGKPGAGAPPPDLPPKLVRLLGKTRLGDQRAREEALHRLFEHELQAGFGMLQRYFLHLWD